MDKVFLIGDFNFPNFDWVNQVPLLFDQLHIKMFELLNGLFLTQMNQNATRNNNILDLVFTSTPDLVNDVSASEGFVDRDHRSVTCTIDLNLDRVTPRPKFVLDFKKANLRELQNTLHYIPWDFSLLDNDINTNLSNWEDLFWSAVNEFIPKKKIKDRLTPPWIDKEVKTLCRKKYRASRKALKSKDPKDIEYFKAIRRKCKKLIRSKYNGYLNDLSKQISTNPKKFWNFHSSKTKTRRIPSALIKDENGSQLIIDAFARANLFNDYFNSVFSQLDTEPPPPGLYPIVLYMSELSFITLSTDEV